MKFSTRKFYLIAIPMVMGSLTLLGFSSQVWAYHPFDSQAVDMTVTGNTGEVVDDNITFTKNSKKSDWITELVAGVKTVITGKKHLLDLFAEDKQQIYAKHSNFTNNSQNVQLGYLYDRTKRDRIGFLSIFRHYYNPEEFSDAFGRTAGQYSYMTSQTDLNYTRDVTKRLTLTATGGGGISIIDKKVGTNSSEFRGGASGEYKMSTKWSLLSAYNFSMRTFKGGIRNMIHAMTAGTRFYFTDRLFWDVIGGFQIIDTADGDILGKPYVQTSLNGEINKKTTARIFYSQRTETTSYSQSIFSQWRLSADITRKLWKKLSAFLSAFYGHGKYQSTNIEENYLGLTGGLVYEISEHFKIVGNYSFSKKTSDQNDNEYNKNVASLRIVFTF